MRTAMFIGVLSMPVVMVALRSFPVAGPSSQTLWQGRYLGNMDGSATFDWPGVRLQFTVQSSTQVSAVITCPGTVAGILRVYVDGANRTTVFTSSTATTYLLASGLDVTIPHTIELYNILEGALIHPQPFLPTPPYSSQTIVSIEVDGSLGSPPTRAERSLVFVGDSITAGFGAGGESGSCPNTGVYSEDNSFTYGALLCQTFSAACETIAWSGKGLYENSPTAGTNQTLPSYYTQTLATGQVPYAATWDFTRNVPSAVLINLGTNDFGHNHDTGPAWESNFTAAYVSFMRNLTMYHSQPHLPIFAAIGPLTSKPESAIQSAVRAFNAEFGGNATFISLDDGQGGEGCNGHPGPRGHAAMAALARPVIAAVMGWD